MAFELDRRRFLGLGAAVAGTGLLAACGPGTSGGGNPAAASGKPQSGGEIIYLAALANPGYQQQQIGSWHILQYWQLFVEYLFYTNEKSELLPHLATGYKANSDFTKFTIGVRKGVTFSNGEKLDAEAVALNLNLLGLGQTSQGIPRVANLPPTYKQAVAVDEYDVEVTLTDPFPAFIRHLAGTSTAAILAPATIKLPLAQQSNLSNTFATGPWTVESWVPSKEVVLKRRDDYSWPRPDAAHKGPAYLEKITIQQESEDELRVGALESGQAHIIHYTIPSAETRLKKEGFNVFDFFGPGSVWGLHFRVTAPNVADVRVRQALSRAIDRQQIIDTLYNPAWRVAQGPVNRATPWGVDLYDKFSYDPDQANKLLDEAGWTGRDAGGYRTKDGQTLEVIEYPSVYIETSLSDLTLIAQQWQKVGVKLTLKNVDYDNYPSVTSPKLKPPVPLYEIHWGAPYPTYLWRWWATGQQDQFDDPTGGALDQYLTKITAATTDEEAYSIAKQVQEYVIDNAYFIPVHEFPQNFASTSKLRGVKADGYPRIQLYDAWLAG